MKNKSSVILPIIFAVLICVSVIALARRGYIYPELGGVINFIVTPADYFKPLAKVEIRKDTSTYHLRAVHKYPAQYEVRLTMPSDITDKRFLALRASIDVRLEGKIVFHSEEVQSGGFAKPDVQSLVLGEYYTPKPVPVGDAVDIEVNFKTAIAPLLPKDHTLFIEIVAAARG